MIQVVASSMFLRNMRNLDFFTMDLGKSKKVVGKDEFRKLDAFVIKYTKLYERNINKFGKIGDRVVFYEDLKILDDVFLVFMNEDIYEISYTEDDIKNIKDFILETLRKIDNLYNDTSEMNDDEVSDAWVSGDIKNGKKKYLIDQTLSREDYRKELLDLVKKKQKNK